MMDCTWCLFLTALVILTFAGSLTSADHGACETDDQAAKAILKCLAPLDTFTDWTDLTLSTIATHEFCQNSVPRKLDCLRIVYSECAQGNPSVNRRIRRLTDFDIIRNSLKYFCDNVNVAIANEKCIDRHMRVLHSCAAVKTQAYQLELAKLTIRALSDRRIIAFEENMKYLCNLSDGELNCLDPIKSGCGDGVANLFRALVLMGRQKECTKKSFPGLGQGVSEPGQGGSQGDSKPDRRGGDRAVFRPDQGSRSGASILENVGLMTMVSIVITCLSKA